MLQPPLLDIDCGCVFPWLTLTQGYTFLLDLFPICSRLLEDLSGMTLPTLRASGFQSWYIGVPGLVLLLGGEIWGSWGKGEEGGKGQDHHGNPASPQVWVNRGVLTLSWPPAVDFTEGGMRRESLFQDGA